ncbi:alpha/beta fold hydrolase [Candidatus Falkowbacteria bacterium]|jgi:pimeloyl-ACP methyl ester carboxylesterase|nr:alpha/beta fold hydrolase [Candidatus Falkowbacteria bacterium]
MEGKVEKIITPKKFVLNGFVFGPKKAKNIFIYVHGLAGSLFSHLDLFEKIIDKNNAVLAFNNRGSGIITPIKRLCASRKKGYKTMSLGMVHEVFTDCVDDIEGAIMSAKSLGAKNIFLLGYSTGCQKSIYYLAKKQKTPVKGAILLAPMSDYAITAAWTDQKVLAKAVSCARKMVREGQGQEFMPKNIWPDLITAQRFLSLNTADSVEEIFTYASNQPAKILQRVKKPLLVILAGEDEYRDRPIKEIAAWFEKNIDNKKGQLKTIKNSLHGFRGHEAEVARVIKKFTESAVFQFR